MMAALIIGMACAFILGAWIRKPFNVTFVKKEEPKVIPEKEEKENDISEQFEKMMNYTGRTSEDE